MFPGFLLFVHNKIQSCKLNTQRLTCTKYALCSTHINTVVQPKMGLWKFCGGVERGLEVGVHVLRRFLINFKLMLLQREKTMDQCWNLFFRGSFPNGFIPPGGLLTVRKHRAATRRVAAT